MYVNQTTLIEYNIDLKMDEKKKFFFKYTAQIYSNFFKYI